MSKMYNTIILNISTGIVVETLGPFSEGKAKRILHNILRTLDTDTYLAEAIPDRFI